MTETFSFEMALKHLRAGRPVTRRAWRENPPQWHAITCEDIMFEDWMLCPNGECKTE